MRILRTLTLSVAALLLSVMSWASTIVYTFKVVDDSGVPVAGATLAQNTVKSLASGTLGNTVNGLTLPPVDLGNGDYGLAYDAEGSNGEILVNFTASKVGSTLSGQNASISLNLTKDSSRLLNADVATSTRLATSGYTAPPTAVQVRQEMDANSTQLAAHTTAIAALPTAGGIASAVLAANVGTGVNVGQALLASMKNLKSYQPARDTVAHTQLVKYFIPGTADNAAAAGTGTVLFTATVHYATDNSTILYTTYN